MLVVRDLFCGKSHFRDFLASPEGIATNILASRLAQLTSNGLIERAPDPVNGREAYRLTAAGRKLRPLLEAISDWGLANLRGTQARLKLAT